MFTKIGFEKTWQYIDLFKQGLICTVSLSALTVFFGFFLALLLAVMRMSDINVYRLLPRETQWSLRLKGGVFYALSRFNPVSFIASVYVEVFRATPMLVQLFIIYYVVFAPVSLPTFKLFGFIRFERFLPGVVALAMNSGAYLCEIIRAGIQSIDGGQAEAARSLGMNPMQNMRFVILPQAIKNILPAIANEFVTIIKESSICYTIGVQEIMYAVASTKGAIYRIGEPLIIATCVYFCLTFPTSKIIAYFEKKMSVGDHRNSGDNVRTRKRKSGFAGQGAQSAPMYEEVAK
ncbi:MAG: amino acid ABC transporter permease [Clostridiales bacterium]|nr:amino acid ABC transporter permease [Clostridiales bacterium]